ncbi:hypothetical protein JRO89_XS01G0303800 [Xanthoceras sorbifolium]|uniref:Glyoxylate/hydroxypyruvate reductase HPR3 n=1 Tax=Xanthoceras sorbifolium TaxID=99658 RepID=A0ABQ8IM92_9ROSI|nr:hypothetical protein JRO89_XS01G0303800 [Xanthoceras sorbifolium]
MEIHQKHDHQQPKDLPGVLVVKPPPPLTLFGDKFVSEKFKLLKAWESLLPLEEFLISNSQSIQAILCSGASPVTPDILRLLPSLRLVVTASAGLNHINLPECHRRGITVTNSGNVFSDDCADAAVGSLIDVWRKVSAADRYVRQGLWMTRGDYALGSKNSFFRAKLNRFFVIISIKRLEFEYLKAKSNVKRTQACFLKSKIVVKRNGLLVDDLNHQLGGKRVGIVGLGRIGLEVAKRLEAFGCTILYNSRKEKPVSYTFYSNICELAANSNALIICCGLTDQTRHMIDRQVLLALGKKGVIVNIGRGPIIDEKELVRCLVEGEIGGAGLDVFENEPNVPQELFALDNVVMSPHSAAFTTESFIALCELVVGNLEAFFSDKPLLSPVTDD